MKNSLHFSFIYECLNFAFLLKGYFTGHSILGVTVLSFQHLKNVVLLSFGFHSFWWEIRWIWWEICGDTNHCFLLCNVSFFLAAFEIFFFIFCFQPFDYVVCRCGFFEFTLFLNCWASWVYEFGYYFFNIFFCPNLFLLACLDSSGFLMLSRSVLKFCLFFFLTSFLSPFQSRWFLLLSLPSSLILFFASSFCYWAHLSWVFYLRCCGFLLLLVVVVSNPKFPRASYRRTN